jgi:outer membrane autotransporter protein
MTGGRQSDYSLFVSGPGFLNLHDGEYRFSGGTQIAGGTLVVWDTLVSDVTVVKDLTGLGFTGVSELWLTGTLRGNLANHESLSLRHKCGTSVNACVEDRRSRIEGNYLQSATGTLTAVLGWDLQITGQASLDGLLTLIPGTSASYVLPSTPSSVLVLHAEGGVSGQFAAWNTERLFLSGALRYTSNDVFFDLTRLSLQNTMAVAAAGDALTLGSASNIDNAFQAGDRFAVLPDAALTNTQRQFVASAAAIQHLDDYGQAVRTFDSLSGHGHLAAVDALLLQAATSGPRASAHTSSLRPGSASGLWSTRPALVSTSSGSFSSAQTTGYDQWLGDRLVVGGSFGWSDGDLQFDRSGGSARSQSPQWNIYLRRNGDNGYYTMGEAGYSRHRLSLERPIDLGDGARIARSERNLDATHAYVEAGRGIRMGRGQLTPFASLSYAASRSDGFIEHGNTGFELMAGPSFHERVSSDIGLRYARNWHWGTDRWLQLDLGARYQHRLAASDDAHAAFTGTPGAVFALNGLPYPRNNSWWEANLAGGAGDRWTWLLSYDNRVDRQSVSVGVEIGF